MTPFRFTLHGDGSSDAMLLPVVRWVLMQHLEDVPLDGQFTHKKALLRKRLNLADQLLTSVKLFPCDLLIVHRDTEAQSREERLDEVRRAVEKAKHALPPHVCVVPVRMSEAWMLFDEAAIRSAAENPNGKCKLSLPSLKRIESIADPKAQLNTALETASELAGRRLDKFRTRGKAVAVAGCIDDFLPLRQLSAFKIFEADIARFAKTWSPPE